MALSYKARKRWSLLILLVGMQAIPQDLYDSAAVDVCAPRALRLQPCDERTGLPREEFFAVLRFALAARQHHAAFTGVRPGREREGEVIGAAADDERVDGVEDRAVAVVFTRAFDDR